MGCSAVVCNSDAERGSEVHCTAHKDAQSATCACVLIQRDDAKGLTRATPPLHSSTSFQRGLFFHGDRTEWRPSTSASMRIARMAPEPGGEQPVVCGNTSTDRVVQRFCAWSCTSDWRPTNDAPIHRPILTSRDTAAHRDAHQRPQSSASDADPKAIHRHAAALSFSFFPSTAPYLFFSADAGGRRGAARGRASDSPGVGRVAARNSRFIFASAEGGRRSRLFV